MPSIVLLPLWEQAPTWDGIVGNAIPYDSDKRTLQDIKPDWLPRIEDVPSLNQVEAFAFPTPFAWAEMMASIIRQGRFDHVLFRLYENLILGLALGHLQLDVVDLRGLSFGKVLAEADDRYRYFGILRGKSSQGLSELGGKVFGGTSPETLLWPSPRRTDAEWQALREAISNSNQDNAYFVLADFRSLLQREKLWNPDQVVWMKGLEQILRNRKPQGENRSYHVHSRTVGPILADLPNGELKRLYFPVYEEKFAAHFLRGLAFKRLQRETDRISVHDTYKKCYEILLPITSADGDLLKAGAGTVHVLGEPDAKVAAAQIQLEGTEDRSGLFELLQNVKKRIGGDLQQIKQQPFFFPDAFRIPVSRLGEAGIDPDVSFSTQAYQLTFDPNSAGLPLSEELIESQETYGICVKFDDSSGHKRKAIYIDDYKGSGVGDLRALGWVLWCYFTTESERQQREHTDDKELEEMLYVVQNRKLLNSEHTVVFKDSNDVRPFDFTDEVSEEIYKKVKKDGVPKPRKLAKQQRFLKAYKNQHDNVSSPINWLCLQAAKAFISWAWPEFKERSFLPNGPLRDKGDAIALGTLSATLLIDEEREVK